MADETIKVMTKEITPAGAVYTFPDDSTKTFTRDQLQSRLDALNIRDADLHVEIVGLQADIDAIDAVKA